MVVQSLPTPSPGVLSPGARVYAVGDVHGCADRLEALHQLIAQDLKQAPVERPLLLHIGDYIDRGPDSAAVVGRLAAGSPLPGVPMVNLRGNHEQMMLDSLTGDPIAARHWRNNNADSTLRSWGIAPKSRPSGWASALPERDLAFLRGLKLFHRLDGYVFVHAGVRPGVPLPDQHADDLLWIREAFLTSIGPLLPEAPNLVVVHGHTPESAPVITGNRIGIDTGAVRGGALTCAVLEGREVRFLTA
jgi:serine/threonine protein phosphatase 1